MTRIANPHASIEQMTNDYLKVGSSRAATGEKGLSFEEILSGKAAESDQLKFSKHASERLTTRSIDLTEEMSRRLQEGVKRAGEKGIKDSLVVVDSYAFIVNVPNKTVVTAMDQGETGDHIFTNIDGAVIA